jgi:hypothetical protein
MPLNDMAAAVFLMPLNEWLLRGQSKEKQCRKFESEEAIWERIQLSLESDR